MTRNEQKLIAGPVEGYKIMNADMTCRGYQFTQGPSHVLENNEPLELCKNGFHFCPQPSGVWNYYTEGRVFKIRAYGVLDTPVEPGADFKQVCAEIEILEEVVVTGNWNTGNGNTGNWNTGDENTGDGNTGNGNTGNWNTGDGNTGDFHSGSLNWGEAPLYMFNKLSAVPRYEIDWYLVGLLSTELQIDAPINPTKYLSLPNASPEAIKQLHDAHIAARKALKNE